ncbi:MAG: histidinol-phosphate transaminase [Betaproteobacteria bacterium]|nr:histidinol-phosphate transaminase [Betaproteobacteria bacterium]
MSLDGRVNIRHLDTSGAGFEADFQRVLHWSAETDAAIETRVAEIIADVRKRGDAALLELTARFDGVRAASVAELEIGADELLAAFEAITPAQRSALQAAAERVRDYHQRQLDASSRSWHYSDSDGTRLGQKVTPLDRVGIYVPGGKAAYPSSVLMNAIPAHVAGVPEIIMVVPTPARRDGSSNDTKGERNALVLAAAHVAGAHRVFTLGGAQAVAALAYGTATVPRVDKITGPGNAYVASAKRRVFGQVGIDMIAGPSEILVLADGSTPPDWVAMDLFSQAEHDELAQSILLCPDADYITRVHEAIDRLLPGMPRRGVIRASLEGRGALIHTRSMEEACAISNRIAPEHLEVSSREPGRWEPLLRHAGAIFLGAYTSESLGDYCAGPNHVLPTSGTARFSSPLGVYDFVKRSSLIEVSEAGAQVLGPIAAELAYGEGLQAHARAAELRLAPAGAATAQRATGPLAERFQRTLRQDVQSMHAYAIQPSAGFVKLDAMENPFALPPELQRELGERLGRVAINRYTSACVAELVAALTRFVDLPTGHKLIVGNGSDELIDILSVACDVPGATVLAPLPGFVMYEMSAKLRGLNFVGVPLTADFELDEAAMLAAIETHRPAITYIAYPNNPTANLFDDAVIERIVAAIGCQNGLVVFDEAYQPFSSRTWLPRLGQHDHVLVLRTLSKFGLAGVRLGYLCGPAALVDEIDKVRPPYNVSVLNAEAAMFALEHADEYARQAALLRSERTRLMAELAATPGVQVFPSDANMVLVRVSDSKRAFEGLKARGVLVKHIAGLHPLLVNCLRLTVGTPAENDLMIRALKESL